MLQNWLTRPRVAQGREVREPSLLALGLAGAGLLAVLALCLAAIAALPAFGYSGWAFLVIAVLLAWLILGGRSRREPVTSRQLWFGRSLRLARKLFAVLL